MEQLEKVERLREKTGLSYEEAKKALEENDWNLLDAIVALEMQGKVNEAKTARYSTDSKESEEFVAAGKEYEKKCSSSFGDMVDRFFGWCGKMINKSCENFFEVRKNNKTIISMPVLVLILLFLFAFWVIVPLLVIGLFCDFHYHFCGEIAQKVDLNKACDKASEACENIKQDFKKDDIV